MPSAPVIAREDGLGGQLDVGAELDADAVLRRGGAVRDSLQALREGDVPGGAAARVGQIVRGGVDDDHAAQAVDDDHDRRCDIRESASLTPTTAGISRARAMIAVWLVRVPTSVTKPTTGSSDHGGGVGGGEIVGDDDERPVELGDPVVRCARRARGGGARR